MSFYIPPKLKITSVYREDTFEKKLSFVLPSEKNGMKFRQETSLANWIKNKKVVGTDIIDNVPRSGYFINKGITRVSYSSFGGKTQKLRIYNELGFEFEVDMMCVGMLAASCNISKGEIKEDCILAWDGKDLVLLPTSSVEYMDIIREKNVVEEHKSAVDSGTVSFDIGQIFQKGKKKYAYLGKYIDLNIETLMKTIEYSDFVKNDDDLMVSFPLKEKHYFMELYEYKYRKNNNSPKLNYCENKSEYIQKIKDMIPLDLTISSYNDIDLLNNFKSEVAKIASMSNKLTGENSVKKLLLNVPDKKNYFVSSEILKVYKKVVKTRKYSYLEGKFLDRNSELVDLEIKCTPFGTNKLHVDILFSKNGVILFEMDKTLDLALSLDDSFTMLMEGSNISNYIYPGSLSEIKIEKLFNRKEY